jgi:DNA-binding NarL/FixJ family response regulator
LIEAMRRVLRGEIAVSEKIAGRLLKTFSGRKTMDSPLEGLSDRELEVFQLIGQGNNETNCRRIAFESKNDRSASLTHSGKAARHQRG